MRVRVSERFGIGYCDYSSSVKLYAVLVKLVLVPTLVSMRWYTLVYVSIRRLVLTDTLVYVG